MKRCVVFAAAALALLAQTGAAAHVTLAEPEAAPNAYYVGAFRVSHGCGDSPTVAFRVELPEGVSMARPQPKPGWTVEIEREALPAPVRSEHGEISERVSAVTWRGQLPADQFDEFALLMRLPNRAGPLYFRAMQTCESGGRAWADVAAAGQSSRDLLNPAPVLTIRAPAPAPVADPHAHHH